MGKRSLGAKGSLAGLAVILLTWSTLATASAIHSWRDDQGRLHFGDRPPADVATEDLSDRYRHELPFQLSIKGIDYQVPPELHDLIALHITRIFHIYRQTLSVEYRPDQDFDIYLYGDADTFKSYQQQLAPHLKNVIGFYNMQDNRISALATDNIRQLLNVLIHEASHAVTLSNGHMVPLWLNEGLAEYFANMHVFGLTAEIRPARHWLNMTRALAFDIERLEVLLDASPDVWHQLDRGVGQSYGPSWSLAYFLMSSEQGRDLIQSLLDASAEDQFVRSTSLIEQDWPGGLAAFHEQWQKWLQNSPAPHRY